MDPFHVVAWATKALDEVRRDVWNAARKGGMKALAGELQGARFALWKNPEDLTANQAAKLAWIAKANARLYRAYLIKEQLRAVFQLKDIRGVAMLDQWLAWACRCRIGPFVELAAMIRRHRVAIEAALIHGLSNARIELIGVPDAERKWGYPGCAKRRNEGERKGKRGREVDDARRCWLSLLDRE